MSLLPPARVEDLEPEIAEQVLEKPSPEPIVLDPLEDGTEVRPAEDVLLAELLIDPRVPVLVVERPLLGIREHRVGLGDLLETVLGFLFLLHRDPVGMRAERELTVGLLQLFRRGAFLEAEDFVVIACGRHGRTRKKAPLLRGPFSPISFLRGTLRR